ncbi:GTP-binding protein Obg [Liquorilactobacillus sucicola DSM 21376 = JCM 15457]|uniref:GTPase Obg n=1 Tax=Liquorilactobacillus sucicola DSM 21376 = JCM 15457 TaxID=1423806 RepID=A0A023CUR0_9LACO|nr:GTPase ObgE [Liquorilactobacillus sucicola]KRN05191.1 GTPase CgtA [Liquorilactobacillus sucicola DSM 21376 = JCM 15457]GAJ25245.1 GTP-binding protein Obg [Liquorilactobacillus sucicola DSM 21376 = JCM 15457]
MFVDQVKINVKAGDGGDGMVAFRREKYVPNGGPAGGDGGKGGSVVLKVDEGLHTLMDFRYHRHFKAKSGGKGMIKGMYGRGAKDLYISVPEGTTVTDAETGEVLGDLLHDGDELTVAHGGRGGRGNIHFASPRNPAPEIAENGEPGVERVLKLELKVLADVGLVGFPSVGKSTLLAAVTSARPKIAEYHFTTLVPNLGMVRLDDGRDFVLADLPGLIEGASQGVGLGIQFLRHVERTRVILHVIDMSGTDGRDPYDDFLKINQELVNYDSTLLERPQIIVASKMDLTDAQENLKKFKNMMQQDHTLEETPGIMEVSSVTRTGLKQLLLKTADILDKTPVFPTLAERTQLKQKEVAEYVYQEESNKTFEITRDSDATWVLSGEKIEKLFKMTNLDHDESVMRFARQLRGMGVDDALRQKGAQQGDLVRIGKFTFEFVE